MEIVIGVAAKVAEYAVGPIVRPIARHIVRPIARPFMNLWEYKSNLENLKKEVEKLEEKRESVQRLTNVGVEPLPDVKAWQDDVTNIIHEVSSLTSENNPQQQSMKCCEGCTYSNLKERYQRSNNVARKLKDVAQLLQEVKKSTSLWEYKSNLENLKKEVEKLVARRESVLRLIKDGEEPLQHVKLWQDNVNKIIDESSGLANPQQQNMQCCNGLICSDLVLCYPRRNNVAQMLEGAAQLLQEARDFREVSTISEETVYKSNLEKLKKEVEKLEAKRDGVKCSIKVGEESLPDVKLWLDKVNSIINEVSGLTSQHNPQQQNNVARILEDVAQLLQEAMKSTSLWEYKSNLQKLKKEVETLNFKRETVQRLIKVGEEPLPDVSVWQDKVKKIIDEVPGLTIEHNPEHQNKVAQMLKEIAQLLLEVAQFREVSRPSIPEQTWLQPSIQLEFSESRMSILKDITAALTNADVNMVGIYGMGGVGKTTLAKKVGSQAMQDKLFDRIVFVEVSHPPDIRTIQGAIADYLGLKFQEETVPGRAIKLCDVLKKEKKILIILDNLWKGIKLEEAGIPFGNHCKGLKLLLTARSRDVLTKGMDSQHNFHVEALSEADAWILFKSIAGTCIDHPHLKSVAQEVAKKCGGMPVAIVTIAKALKDTQSEDEWKEALRRLNNPSSDSFEGITKEVYNSIKLSYDCLDGKLKEIFLLCSLMGCTYDASVEDLFRYGLGLGFFDEFDRVEDALCNVYASVNQLKAASLLLDAHASHRFFRPILVRERFAIHDVICAVARSIASEDRHALFVPQSLTNENKLKNCTSISLYNIGELPKDLKLVCPQLKFLYVNPMLLFPKSHSRISDKFFARMPKLQVLHLIGIDLQTLSTPFSDLVNLRTLCLEQCILKRIVDVGDLENLEILSFRGPEEMYRFHGLRPWPVFKLSENKRQLSKLRLLELNCYGLDSIPSEFILSFKKLEALYMGDTTITWEAEKSNSGSRNASLDVLEHLSNLTSLEIRVRDATMLRGLLSPKLERYSITIGSYHEFRVGWDIICKTSRFLQIKLITNEDGIISRLMPIRQLVLDEVPGIANNFCGLDRKGFPQLEDLKVQNNSHIVHIVDEVSGDRAFPVLKSLILQNLINLKTICNGSLGMKLFHQLRIIKVGRCHELTNFFSFGTDRVFQELEEIEVEHCETLKKIFAISEQVHKIKFSKLHILRLTSLPQLESLCCNVKTQEIILKEERDVSKPLFNDKVEVTNLETLEINNINVKSIWDKQLPTMADIPTLTCLIISNLPNLTRLSSGDYIKFPLLKEMTIESCPKFKEFFFDDKVGVPSLEKIKIFKMDNLKIIWHNQLVEESFPKLKSLQVEECHNLTRLGSGDYIKFPLLKEMTIISCPKFKEVFFDDKVGVPSLEEITIFKMDNLKMIWHNQLVGESFPKLKSLHVRECHNLTRLVSGDYIKFPLLKEMTIISCPKFKEFFFDDKVGVPSLQKVNIFKMENLKMIWHNQLVEDSFSKLKSLQVQECHKLLTLFQSNMCGRFSSSATLNVGLSFANLQNLKVSECQSLKTIVAKEEVEAKEVPGTVRFVFPKLTSLGLYKLPELRTFYPGKYVTEWPVLKRLKMHQCGIHDINNMRVMQQLPLLPNEVSFEFQVGEIWPNLLLTMSSWVQNLTMLTLHGCDNLEELFPYSMVVTEELSEKKMGNTIVFPKLNYLEMKQLANLKGLCSGCHIELPTLKEFKISVCSQLTAFVFDDKIKVPSLTELKISSMDNLKMIWDNQLVENSIPKLKSLQVQGCQKLLTLFRSNLYERFLGLETLDVSDCGSLEEIFDLHAIKSEERHFATSTQSEELYTTAISFANLENLKVSECGSLKSLFSVSNIAKDRGEAEEMHATARFFFPKLTSLELYKLSELRTFYPARYTVEWPVLRWLQLYNYGTPETDDEEQMQHLLFFVKKAVPSLRKLTLSGSELMMMWQGQDLEPLFRNFKILEVLDESKADYLFYESQPALHYIGDVKYMWKQNFKLDLILPIFEKIVVGRCDSFISLMPPSASFRNLTSLVVNDCNSLEHIGTFSMAKNLAKLVSLRIYRCEKIVEVLRNHEDVTGDKILFSNLKRLSLADLPSLTSFCSWNFTLEFPSLEELVVRQCPNMKIFSQGEVTTPKLHEVISEWRSIKLCPDVDVSTAIQQLHEQKQVAESFTE